MFARHQATEIGTESKAESLGKLLLRVSIAALMLFHGVAKIQNGVGGIEQTLAGHGLPEVFAYGVYVGEVLAPLLMIVGLLTRVASLVLVFNMVVAIGLSHANEIFTLGSSGGWAIELQMLYLLGALAVALIGPGRFAVPPSRGPWA